MNDDIATCSICKVAVSTCICDTIEPIQTATQVLILRHPQEVKAKFGTANLIQKLIPHAVLRTGLSWRNLKQAVGFEANPKEWVVLYLGSKKINPLVVACSDALVFVDKKGVPLTAERTPSDIKGVILLDGNWQQSKALWWRNSWLIKCQRGVINPQARSLYGKKRREPRKESISSIEALAEALAFLSGQTEIRDSLLEAFDSFLKRVK